MKGINLVRITKKEEDKDHTGSVNENKINEDKGFQALDGPASSFDDG
jgi:hypothetical protein